MHVAVPSLHVLRGSHSSLEDKGGGYTLAVPEEQNEVRRKISDAVLRRCIVRSENLLSLYVPKKYEGKKLIIRLQKIADREDRSVNAISCRALMEYVENYGKRSKK